MDFRPRHLLQVLQVGVEQVAAGQRNPQNPLDDVADGAVVRETDLFCRVHEVAAAGEAEGQRGSELMRELGAVWVFSFTSHLAHGLIFKARPRLTQNPAPPVANQKFTAFWKDRPNQTCLTPTTWSRKRRTAPTNTYSPSCCPPAVPWPRWAGPDWASPHTCPECGGTATGTSPESERLRSYRRPRDRTT